ncbi:hypothetical protein [Nocardioides litoris]|uniref:hypothetical protein n=1 Tax=Nocardioides litoris TaxID=1926648 RepID=UPI00112303AF|nr:hypothetical protein [Nocardioides litoris]
MPSPMPAPRDRSTVHIAPRPPIPCEVHVTSGAAPDGWYDAELLEWISYPSTGWVGMVRYRTGPSGGYVGCFSPADIRRIEPPA